jgi:hypothetical protein
MQFPEFAQSLKPLLGGTMSKGEFTAWLFDTISDYDDAHFSKSRTDSTLRAYFNGKRPLGPAAREAVSHLDKGRFSAALSDRPPDVLDGINSVLSPYCPGMNPSNVCDACADLFADILVDASAEQAPAAQAQIIGGCNQRDLVSLALCVGCICPLCGKSLVAPPPKTEMLAQSVATLSSQVRADYRLINRYTESLPAQCADFAEVETIALCSSCAAKYRDNPSPEMYVKLAEAWTQLRSRNELTERLAVNPLDSEIAEVLDRLLEHEMPNDIELSLQPVRVRNKIDCNNWLLAGKVQAYVATCFSTISGLLADLDGVRAINSGKISGQIKSCFCDLDRMGLTQPEIFQALAKWVTNKSGVDSLEASEALVSYFIQDCEVFYEIPQQGNAL